MADPILEVSNLTVQFGALKAVDGVSLALKAGERRAVIGPNGAGKTTLFNAISGTTFPAIGKITFNGHNITKMSPARRAHLRITRTFQITNLFGQLTVLENMRLAARGLSRSKFLMLSADRLSAGQRDRVNDALSAVLLMGRENTPVKLLSHGEQRQLEVAMALASDPLLLLLDEPAAGLSPIERQYLSEVIRGLPRTMSIILIEHDMDLALGLADHVTVMQNGTVIAQDVPGNIRGNPQVQEVYLGTPHNAGSRSEVSC